MTAKGVVVSLSKDKAIVKCQRQSACESCHNCKESGACHAELIFGEANREVTVEADNALNAKIGDNVEISSSTAHTLLYSVIIFILPCIFSTMGYALMNGFNIEVSVVPLVVVGIFAVSFVLISKLLNRFIKNRHALEIIKILGEIDE